MVNEVGFLDDRFFMNGEDTDLSFRARLAGWEVWFAAEAIVRHRVSGTQGVGSPNSVYFNERNWIWSVVKCMPATLFWKYAWVQVFELPARACYFTQRGRFAPWCRGILAGIAGSWSYRAARQKIQSHRRARNGDLERFFRYPAQMGGRDEPASGRA
jgi:GT2 family glycosyltransferase